MYIKLFIEVSTFCCAFILFIFFITNKCKDVKPTKDLTGWFSLICFFLYIFITYLDKHNII